MGEQTGTVSAHIRSVTTHTQSQDRSATLWTTSVFVSVQAVLEVCDQTGSVCVVLWNSVCVSWYRCLRPGDIISLRRYRVKPQYHGERDDMGTHRPAGGNVPGVCGL